MTIAIQKSLRNLRLFDKQQTLHLPCLYNRFMFFGFIDPLCQQKTRVYNQITLIPQGIFLILYYSFLFYFCQYPILIRNSIQLSFFFSSSLLLFVFVSFYLFFHFFILVFFFFVRFSFCFSFRSYELLFDFLKTISRFDSNQHDLNIFFSNQHNI